MLIPPHYRTLGIDIDASGEEIHKAYRSLAKKYHPDANQGDPRSEELFKRVSAAYMALSDPKSRRIYDKLHSVDLKRTARNARPHSPKEGRNIRMKFYLDVEEVCAGGAKEVRYSRDTTCAICDGKGLTAPHHEECISCSGTGIVNLDYTTHVEFPPGTRNRDEIRAPGAGHMGRLKSAGDLLIEVQLKTHRYLAVQDADLHYKYFLGLEQYIEGGDIEIPTPQDVIKVKLPPRFPDGGTLRLQGRGLPASKNRPGGDLIITVEHCLPKRLSRKERVMIQELMEMPSFNPPADNKNLFPKGED